MKKKLIIMTLIFLLVDQISKFIVVSNLNPNDGFTIIPSFFSLLYVQNTGAAWGILSDGTIFLALLSIVFLLFAIKYVLDLENLNSFKIVNFSLLFGGIIGNLLDRIIRNYVVDFFSFKIFSYSFPVFNIADCFIVISIILILIEIIVEEKKGSE